MSITHSAERHNLERLCYGGNLESSSPLDHGAQMANPDISVVLPVFNAEDSVAAAVHSIRHQTDADFELVLVDDGSTDGTPDILRQQAAEDDRLRLLTRPGRLGIVSALNTGLHAARGRFVARMDADDLAHPDRLRSQRLFLDDHPDTGLVGCQVAFGGDAHRQAGYAAYVEWTNALLDHEAIALNRFVESPFAHPSVMFRRELITTFGGYRDGPFPEDYELWLRWLEAGVRMAKIPEVLLTWNDPAQRLSRTHSRYSPRAFYECKAGYLGTWLEAHNPHHPDVIVWGAGRETRRRAEMLCAHGVCIRAYVDIDPRKLGQTIHRRPVLDEKDLPSPADCFVLPYVGSRGARDDIRQRLAARGFREGVSFICAA